MKILLVVPSMGVGGAQTFVSNLAQEFEKQSENEIYILSFWDIVDERFKCLLSLPKIHLITLHKKKGFSLSFLHAIGKQIKAINPDIINTHSDSCFLYLLLLPFLHKTPIVHTITNNPTHYLKKYLWFFQKRLKSKFWKTSLIAISESFVPVLKNIYQTDKVDFAQNGILFPHIATLPFDLKKFDFISCGRFSKAKRFELLIEALSHTQDSKLSLILVGDGPEKNHLEELTKRLHLEARISFAGAVSDPMSLYNQARCFVLTSSSEGSPVTIVEAMSLGLPIIATDVGGVRDMVKNDQNGFLLPENPGPQDVALKMDLIEKNRDLYVKMSQNSYEKSLFFDISLSAQRYLSIYNRLVSYKDK